MEATATSFTKDNSGYPGTCRCVTGAFDVICPLIGTEHSGRYSNNLDGFNFASDLALLSHKQMYKCWKILITYKGELVYASNKENSTF